MKRRDFLKSLMGIVGGILGTQVVKKDDRVVNVPVVPDERPEISIRRDGPIFPMSGSGMMFTGRDFYSYTPARDEDVREIVRQGHPVKAMALYRKKYGCQLAEARDVVRAMERDME
jgi:hypothetical protein